METDCIGPCDGRLLVLFGLCGVLTTYAFVAWLWTGNFSHVDNYYSILPAGYAWICYFFQASDRGVLAGLLTSIWACSLTYTLWRRGGFTGVEDYRWAYIRKKFPSQLALCCFSFWFFALLQNLVTLGFSIPAYVISLNPGLTLSWKDYAVAAVMVTFIGLEALADHQQWEFQCNKARLLSAKQTLPGAYEQGFLTSGLFRFSRHPNMFSELALWWTFHVFSLLSSNPSIYWIPFGPLTLTYFMHRSAKLTEKISAGKYPKYADYQKTTSRLIPGWPASIEKSG